MPEMLNYFEPYLKTSKMSDTKGLDKKIIRISMRV